MKNNLNLDQGPLTLRERILIALTVGSMAEVDARLEKHIKEYLFENFAMAYDRAGIDTDKMKLLDELWLDLTKES